MVEYEETLVAAGSSMSVYSVSGRSTGSGENVLRIVVCWTEKKWQPLTLSNNIND